MEALLNFASPTQLADLRAFCLVVDLGSVSASARQLGETKGSISRRLSRLERDLGATLLLRSSRLVQPTEYGRTYHGFALQALRALAKGSAALEQHSAPSGAMRLGCSNGFAHSVLAPLLLSLRDAYPLIQLELVLTDELPNFSTQQLDAAVHAARKLPDSSLIARKLLNWEMKLVASPAYLSTYGTPRRPDDLLGHRVLLGPGPPRTNPRTLKVIMSGPRSSRTVTLPDAVLTTNTVFGRAAALAATTIAIIPDFMVEKDIARGELVELFPGASYNARRGGMFYLYPAATFVPPKVRGVLDFLVSALG
jgi:DNA-binding transcriptional LysR family regulator